MKYLHSRDWSQGVSKNLQRFSFWLSLFSVFLVIYDLGYKVTPEVSKYLINLYLAALFVGSISIALRYFLTGERPGLKVRITDIVILILFIFLFLIKLEFLTGDLEFLQFFNDKGWLHLAMFLYFIREFSSLRINLKRQYFNPAQLFVASFLSIILIGTFLLLLPNATHTGISIIDALFTSTSAVCVTGLIVVDTGSYFTQFGQNVILVLIQLGGLGIMTFASYFSYFFRGKTSYETQLMMKDMTSSQKIGEVFSVLKKILLLTFIIEFIGAILIYLNLNRQDFADIGDRIYFSVFHSISGFCNAGFSTLENSLYEPGFRFNYPLHIVIAVIFILGGLGFPIVLNLFTYFKHLVVNRLMPLQTKKSVLHKAWVVNLNTRIVMMTTTVLLAVGTILFYILEYNNTLAEHSGVGKIVTAFFGASTPRTAGFNTVDYSSVHFATIMVVILLMWIGASPASTGGGIKTSTFAVTTLNFLSLAKGKNRIEIYKREISEVSIRRSFAIVALSLIVIGLSITIIATLDPHLDIVKIVFEAFSAYSTVGLSMGLTSSLGEWSKIVIIITMFVGRVSTLTILIAVLRRLKHLNYRYPSEEVLIN